MTTITIERHALRVAVETAAVAQSNDDLRPHLAGCHLDFGKGTLIASASDGHRLIRTTVSVHEIEGPPVTAFVRREDTKRLIKALRCKKSEQSELVTVEVGDTLKVVGTFEPLELENASDEPTPPYSKVIPPQREAQDKGPGLYALDPRYVADLGVLGRLLPSSRGALISTSSAREPVRFDVGNAAMNATYIVMPMRLV